VISKQPKNYNFNTIDDNVAPILKTMEAFSKADENCETFLKLKASYQ
jgi:hypothetical protein